MSTCVLYFLLALIALADRYPRLHEIDAVSMACNKYPCREVFPEPGVFSQRPYYYVKWYI